MERYGRFPHSTLFGEVRLTSRDGEGGEKIEVLAGEATPPDMAAEPETLAPPTVSLPLLVGRGAPRYL